MIDLFIISHASFVRVNRLIYNHLSAAYSLEIRILVPVSLIRNGKKILSDDQESGDVKIIKKELNGSNPRTYSFEDTLELLNKLKPKCIYLDNDPLSLQALVVGRWATNNNSKLMCLTCENLNIGFKASFERLGYKGIPSILFKLLLAKLTRKYISHVFTISKAGLNIFKENNFKSVSITPLGFDSSIFYSNLKSRALKRGELEIDDETIVLAYIGRTVYEKGVHILLESLSLIKKENWILILDEFSATRTPYQDEIIALIKSYDLQAKVKYFDATHFEIAAYMNAADVVVIPSISSAKWVEQYGRVAPESMACGKLVVASNTGALPEIIADCGVLVEENNSKRLANALNHIIEDIDFYKDIMNSAEKRAYSRYSTVVQAENIYKKFKRVTQR